MLVMTQHSLNPVVETTVLYRSSTLTVLHGCLKPSECYELPQGKVQGIQISGIPLQYGDRKPLQPGVLFLVTAEAQRVFQNQSVEPAELVVFQWHEATQDVCTVPVTEERPWGSFTVLADKPHYKLKQLVVFPQSRLSLQRHQHREEHWLVRCGLPLVTVGESEIPMSEGGYVHIPLQSWHRLANPSDAPVEIIELQLGTYFGEDDIERRSDDYGRG